MYAKIFRQIYDSSIADDWILRTVFQDMLVLADSDGIVDMTPEAISARTRIPLEVVNTKLTELTKPDPRSRSKGEEGRRLIPIDPERGWGWRIVNYETYRKMRCEDDRKSYMRNYMRKYRTQQQTEPVNFVNTCKTQLAKGDPSSSSCSSVLKGESVREGDSLSAVQELKALLATMYKRRNQLIWPQNEEMLMAELVRRPDWKAELEELKTYRELEPKYFPGSLFSLLDGWDRTLDRARNHYEEPSMFAVKP